MFLIKLYTEPEELFTPVEFKTGINFIFGKKDEQDDPKKSLNGIGKSLLLDFIDFALLADFSQKDALPRLTKAKPIIGQNKIVLEFKVNGNHYIIKRNLIKPTQIEFGLKNNIAEFSLKEVKPFLCDLIFKKDNYQGKYFNSWLRRLMPFYIKVDQQKKSKFGDPIQYISEIKELELNQYHFFLLGIDNSLAIENCEIQTELKKKKPILDEVDTYVREYYDLKNVSEAENEIDKIKRTIETYKDNISQFKLAEQYKDIEAQADDLTKKIKNLLFLNYTDKSKLETYEKSLETDVQINAKRIAKLYKEFNDLLGTQINKTLDEAIEFRKQLSKSRYNFLKREMDNLTKIITERGQEIQQLETDRSRLFNFISSQKAIEDLSDAFNALNMEKEKLANLQSQLNMYNQFLKEKTDLSISEKEISKKIIEFLETVKTSISDFRTTFSKIYNSIYLDRKDQSVFAINYNDTSMQKLHISIRFPADLSKGKNHGRTLVYDLFVLFNSIERNYNAPRFLIHDGIFDGMDKAHFVHLYEYLEEQSLRKDFQYIVTLNEEGVLSENFGHTEKVSPEKIAAEAIIVLTPSKKLLGRDF